MVYITEGGMHENDCICVALVANGQWRHFTTDQIKSHKNSTYGVEKSEEKIQSIMFFLKKNKQYNIPSFGESTEIAEAVNRLRKEGYTVKHVADAGNQTLIITP